MNPLRSCLIGILAAFSLSFTTASASSPESNPVLTHPATAEAVGFLVKLRSASSTERMRSQGRVADAQVAEKKDVEGLAQRSALVLRQSRRISGGLHLMEVSASSDSADAIIARLRADSSVESVDIDQHRYPHAVPNDPLAADQWYEQNNQPSAIDAITAWDTTTGRDDIVIADLDTGIRYDHPDLSARLLTGYDFITDAAVANDGDGRDADASDPGDWVTAADVATAKFSKCTASNSSWHGTRTAGIMGAVANNSTGIAGITWNAKILPVRVLGKCGGLDSDILDGMRWAAGLPVDGVPNNTHPARIINMSLGGTGACTSAEQIVINEVLAVGVLVVVSAGNEGGPVDSPANCTGVAGIAGLRNAGTKVGFSSLGPEISLSAPGGNCVNTTGGPCVYPINTTSNAGTTTPTVNGYTDQLNPSLGTSFSAPIVAGIAALMISANSNLKSAQLIARLREGSKTFPVSADTTIPNCHVPTGSSDLQTLECNCTTQVCGAGMANAPGAVLAALRPIAAISAPASVSAGQNVTLSALGSAAACGHTVASYSWSVVGSSGVAIQNANSASAVVVAPSSGSVVVQVTVTDESGATDTAQVTVSSTSTSTSAPASAGNGTCPAAANPVTLAVSPATITLKAGGSQTFTATVSNTSNMAVSWQVSGGGSITAAGVYTAPASVSSDTTVTVTAMSAADSSRTGTATVTVSSSSNAQAASTGGSSSGGGGGGALDMLTLLWCGGVLGVGVWRRWRLN